MWAKMRSGLSQSLTAKGDHAGAEDYLIDAASHLEDCGDMSCWAATNRTLAMGEAALGSTERARERMVALIEAVPDLPIPEVAKPRAVDAAVDVLVAAG